MEERNVCLWGQRNLGVLPNFLQSALRHGLARRACLPQTAGPDTLPPSFRAPGRKTTRKGRKFIYIYNIKSLGD